MSDKKNYYYNRELSWMDFNARVLEEAQKKDNPLMERLMNSSWYAWPV